MTQGLILLDTNVVLYFLGGRLLKPLPLGKYFVSVITEIELLSYPSLSLDEEVPGLFHSYLARLEINFKAYSIRWAKTDLIAFFSSFSPF